MHTVAQHQANIEKDSFLNLKEVCQILSISKTTLYNGIKQGKYPLPYRITKYRTAWSENEILAVVHKIKEQGHVVLF